MLTAMDMHLTGRFMDAAEAERSGLVSRVVPAADLIAEAKAAGFRFVDSRPAFMGVSGASGSPSVVHCCSKSKAELFSCSAFAVQNCSA